MGRRRKRKLKKKIKKFLIIFLIILVIVISTNICFKPNKKEHTTNKKSITIEDKINNDCKKIDYCKKNNLKRYVSYYNKNKDLSIEDIITRVNLDLDYDFYDHTSKTPYLNTDYIMLDYPDKVNGERSDWKSEYSSITNDLKRIITYKKWDKVVTHNKEGEYGHIHHKMTNKIVTGISTDNLYYFGKYYRKPKNLNKIDNEIIEKKKYIAKNLYKSQIKVLEGMSQMYPYENITKYEDWK